MHCSEGEPCDGMAEVWFDSMDDMRKGLASSTMLEDRKDVVDQGITVVTRMFTEEHTVV